MRAPATISLIGTFPLMQSPTLITDTPPREPLPAMSTGDGQELWTTVVAWCASASNSPSRRVFRCHRVDAVDQTERFIGPAAQLHHPVPRGISADRGDQLQVLGLTTD